MFDCLKKHLLLVGVVLLMGTTGAAAAGSYVKNKNRERKAAADRVKQKTIFNHVVMTLEEIGAGFVRAEVARTSMLNMILAKSIEEVKNRENYNQVLGQVKDRGDLLASAEVRKRGLITGLLVHHVVEAVHRGCFTEVIKAVKTFGAAKLAEQGRREYLLQNMLVKKVQEIKRKAVFAQAMLGIQANKALQNNAALAIVKIVSLHMVEVATRGSQADLVTEMKAVGLQKELSRVASRASLEKIVGERKEVADTRCKFAPSLENIVANGVAKTEGIEAINQTLLTRRLSCVDIWQANKGRQARLNLEAINRRTHEDNMNLIFVFPEARAAQRSVRHY